MLPSSSLSEKSPSEKFLTPQLVSVGTGEKRGVNLRAMLSSHSMLCPCVINPEDNSNELKKLVYFNKMYQVRRVAFVTALV